MTMIFSFMTFEFDQHQWNADYFKNNTFRAVGFC